MEHEGGNHDSRFANIFLSRRGANGTDAQTDTHIDTQTIQREERNTPESVK